MYMNGGHSPTGRQERLGRSERINEEALGTAWWFRCLSNGNFALSSPCLYGEIAESHAGFGSRKTRWNEGAPSPAFLCTE